MNTGKGHLKVTDTTAEMMDSFASGVFDMERWKDYIDKAVPGARELCFGDMQECIEAGFTWEKDFLPVLNKVCSDSESREQTVREFHEITDGLDERIVAAFGRTVDVELILYLGLCNGAGWVTEIGGKTVVLLGIEKIIELGWYDRESMIGLIVHELGHVYQAQYGVLQRETESMREHFLWQLFTEGIAMVFEQEIVRDCEYFHQDNGGWKAWCDDNFELIKKSFDRDLDVMTDDNQRYFGDWVKFNGYGDTGYYLGTKFVRFLLKEDSFDNLVKYDLGEVAAGYERFMAC